MQLRQMSITEAPGALVRIWPGEWGAGQLPGWGQCSAMSVPCPPLNMVEHAPVPRRGPRRERGERVEGWHRCESSSARRYRRRNSRGLAGRACGGRYRRYHRLRGPCLQFAMALSLRAVAVSGGRGGGGNELALKLNRSRPHRDGILRGLAPRPTRGRPRRDGRYGRRAARCLRRGVVGGQPDGGLAPSPVQKHLACLLVLIR